MRVSNWGLARKRDRTDKQVVTEGVKNAVVCACFMHVTLHPSQHRQRIG
jgi:hypothetical protein